MINVESLVVVHELEPAIKRRFMWCLVKLRYPINLRQISFSKLYCDVE